MGDRVERLLEVHKAHIECLLVLACLVHQYSEIHDMISCPPSLSEATSTDQYTLHMLVLTMYAVSIRDKTKKFSGCHSNGGKTVFLYEILL